MTTPVSLATVQVADADFLQSAENKDFNENRVTVNYQLTLELKSKLTQVMSSQKEISTAFSRGYGSITSQEHRCIYLARIRSDSYWMDGFNHVR